MTRALIWKEWRTQRSLVLAGLAIAALLPLFLLAGMSVTSPNHGFADLVSMLTPLFVMFVWPVFAAAIAGSTFAADMSDDSLRFLLSRPVSRARVWLIKVGAALAAFVAVVLGTMAIGLIYAWLTADGPRQLRFLVSQQLGGGGRALDLVILLVPFAFLFGCSIYCSTFVKRPMVAAAGGFLVAATIVLAVGLVWMTLVPQSPTSREAFRLMAAGVAAPVATLGIWAAAFWVFWRGDIFGGGAWRRALRPLVVITVLVLLAGTWPAVATSARSLASLAARQRGNLVISEGMVTIPEETPRGYSTWLTRMPVGGGAATILVPKNATLPVVSPDGEWIVYVAHGGYLGMASGVHELRAMRSDGSDDRSISPKLEWPWSYRRLDTLIAPDNDHVAHISLASVFVTTISGGEGRTLTLGARSEGRLDVHRVDVIGWTFAEPVELLYYRYLDRPLVERRPESGVSEPTAAAAAPGSAASDSGASSARVAGSARPDSAASRSGASGAGRSTRATELLAFDPRTGESRLVRDFDGWLSLRVFGPGSGGYPTRSWSRLPVWIDEGDAERLYLIDPRSGEQVEVTESPCGIWGFPSGGNRFVYGRCSGEIRYGNAGAEIRVRDLASGADEPFAVLEGYDVSGKYEVPLAPGGERLLLYTRRGYRDQRCTYVVSRGGGEQPFADCSAPVAWINDREALVRLDWTTRVVDGRDVRFSRFALSIADVESFRLRQIYPER